MLQPERGEKESGVDDQDQNGGEVRLRNQPAEDFTGLPDIDGARAHALPAIGARLVAGRDEGPAVRAHAAIVQSFYPYGYECASPIVANRAILVWGISLGKGVESKLYKAMTENSILFIAPEGKRGMKIQDALLEGMEGKVDFVRVESLFDALRTLQERSFDLIVVDLTLPDSDAIGAVKHLKQDAAGTPVIALCPSAERELGVSAVRNGAHDFFCHDDLDVAALRKSVVSALATGKGTRPAAGRTGGRMCGSRCGWR